MIRLSGSALLKSIAVTIFVTGLYLYPLQHIPLLKIANLKTIDALFALRARIEPARDYARDSVLISIDNESMRMMNARWPWPRSIIADAIRALAAHKPAVISVDLLFSGKSKDEAQDLALAKSFADAGNVFLATFAGEDGIYLVPDESVAIYAKGSGMANKPRDIDNTVRRLRPFLLSKKDGRPEYSLSLKTAGAFVRQKEEDLVRALPLLPDTTSYTYYIERKALPVTLPIWKVLKEGADLDIVKGKMVFVGLTSELFHDIYATPYGMMPGVLINAVESLAFVKQRFFRYAGRDASAIILAILVFIAAVISLRLPASSGMLLCLAETVIFLGLSAILFIKRTIIPDTFTIIMLIAATSLVMHGVRYIGALMENSGLRKEAITDGLTGLYLHRYFELKLKSDFEKASSSRKNELSLIMFDIDHFKRINDTYGHEFGNVALKEIAKRMKENTKKENTVARYGGEEFCVIASGSNKDEALAYAERIRQLVKTIVLKSGNGEDVKMTISSGVASFRAYPFKSEAELIRAADTALYSSKESGRDRVSVFDSSMGKTR